MNFRWLSLYFTTKACVFNQHPFYDVWLESEFSMAHPTQPNPIYGSSSNDSLQTDIVVLFEWGAPDFWEKNLIQTPKEQLEDSLSNKKKKVRRPKSKKKHEKIPAPDVCMDLNDSKCQLHPSFNSTQTTNNSKVLKEKVIRYFLLSLSFSSCPVNTTKMKGK